MADLAMGPGSAPAVVDGGEQQPGDGGASAGPARVLALAYGFFTVAAGARSGVQLSVHPHRALLAYLLSAVAAVIYLGASILLVAAERGHRRTVGKAVRALCIVELAGVALVGGLSLVLPSWFPDATVWSRFGSGYGYVPAVLPVLALGWLHRQRPPSVSVHRSGRGGRNNKGKANG